MHCILNINNTLEQYSKWDHNRNPEHTEHKEYQNIQIISETLELSCKMSRNVVLFSIIIMHIDVIFRQWQTQFFCDQSRVCNHLYYPVFFRFIPGEYMMILYYCMTLNSVVNPWIYMMFNCNLVESLRHLLCPCIGEYMSQ